MTKYRLIKGFSLLEMIIYIAILVLMLGIITNVTISVLRSHRAIKASKSIQNSAIISLERISREIRKANNIDGISSVFDSGSGKLVLDSLDDSGNPRTVEFYIDSNTIFMKENNVVVGALSQNDSLVKSLTFRLLTNLNARGIRTETVIESGTSTSYKVGNFYSTAELRESL